MPDKILPSDDSDYSLPGRLEESNPITSQAPPAPQAPEEPKTSSRYLIIGIVIFGIVATGFFSYYFVNQETIDSEILDNTIVTVEEKMVEKYKVGQFGSDHAHAAFVMYIESERINFGMPNFQLKSKYIHFENHNPYLIHKHATRVPLDMLFTSFGMKINSDCVHFGETQFCNDTQNSLRFFVNGMEKNDISEHEIIHGDRILVFYGNNRDLPEQIRHLESLEIHDIPKQDNLKQDKEFFI